MVEKISNGKNHFSCVFHRDHNIFNKDLNRSSKDLSLLIGKRDLKDIIIVDNCFEGVVQHENVIPIVDFMGSSDDCELDLLARYLVSITKEDDVRKCIQKDF